MLFASRHERRGASLVVAPGERDARERLLDLVTRNRSLDLDIVGARNCHGDSAARCQTSLDFRSSPNEF